MGFLCSSRLHATVSQKAYLQPTGRKSPTMMNFIKSLSERGMETGFRANFADEVMRRYHGSCHRAWNLPTGFQQRRFPINVETWPCNSTAEEAWSWEDWHGQLSARHQPKHSVKAAGKASAQSSKATCANQKWFFQRIPASFNQPIFNRNCAAQSLPQSRAKHRQTAHHRFACLWYFRGVRRHRFWCSSRPSGGGLWHRLHRSRVAALVLDWQNLGRRCWFVSFYTRRVLVWRSTKQHRSRIRDSDFYYSWKFANFWHPLKFVKILWASVGVVLWFNFYLGNLIIDFACLRNVTATCNIGWMQFCWCIA